MDLDDTLTSQVNSRNESIKLSSEAHLKSQRLRKNHHHYNQQKQHCFARNSSRNKHTENFDDDEDDDEDENDDDYSYLANEPRQSKRRRLAPDASAGRIDHDIEPVDRSPNRFLRPRGSQKNKSFSAACRYSSLVPENMAAETVQRFTEIDKKLKGGLEELENQGRKLFYMAADLIGLEKVIMGRLDCLEKNSDVQRHEIKESVDIFYSFEKSSIKKNENLAKAMQEHKAVIEDLRIRTDESLDRSKIALSDIKGELDGHKAITSKLAHMFENMKDGPKIQKAVEGRTIQFQRWHDQTKSQTKLESMANPDAEPLLQQLQEHAKLLGQQKPEPLASMGRIAQFGKDLSVLKSTSTEVEKLKKSMKNRDFQDWLETIARQSAEHRVQQDNAYTDFLEKQATENETLKARVVKLEAYTQGFDKNLADSVNQTDDRQLSLDRKLRENLEENISFCRSIVARVASLEDSTSKFQKMVEAMAVLEEERQLKERRVESQRIVDSKECSQEFDKNLAESAKAIEAGQLWVHQEHQKAFERKMIVSAAVVDRVASLENNKEFRKKLEIAGHIPGLDRIISLEQRTPELQQKMEKIVRLGRELTGPQQMLEKMTGLEQNPTELQQKLQNDSSLAKKTNKTSSERSTYSDFRIDKMAQTNKTMMKRLGALEQRLAASEEKDERYVCKIVELEKGNERLVKEMKSLRQLTA